LKQAAPTANADRAPSIDSEQVTRSGGQRDSRAAKAASNVSRQERTIPSGLSLPTSKSEQATANLAPQKAGVAPSVVAGPVTDAAKLSGGVSTVTVAELPLNGRNFTELQQLQPADTKGAASQSALAREKELPALQIQAASAQNQTLAGISGRITDRSGAVIAQVTVTLRDATGKKRQSTTSTDGSFELMQLPAGQYELTATARGFKTSQQSIELKPSELAMLQPVLDIGTASEQVTVEAASAAVPVQTESANVGQVVGGQVVAEMPNVGRAVGVPSGLPVTASVSHGKRFLSLDDAGNLFLSRNRGKEWKKVRPQWGGKANRIELASGSVSEAAAQKPKDETSGVAGEGAVFLLTTDAGTVWSSKDGAHWHRQ